MLGKYSQGQLVIANKSSADMSILKGIIYVIQGEEIFNDEVVYAVRAYLLDERPLIHCIDLFEPYTEESFDRIQAELKATNFHPTSGDPVIKPDHYQRGGIETKDYIKAKLTKEEFIGYCMGNVLKYTSRYKDKGGVQDLGKAKVYLEWAIEEMRK